MNSNSSVKEQTNKQINKNIYLKIEFQSSVRRMIFLCGIGDIKIDWINP